MPKKDKLLTLLQILQKNTDDETSMSTADILAAIAA